MLCGKTSSMSRGRPSAKTSAALFRNPNWTRVASMGHTCWPFEVSRYRGRRVPLETALFTIRFAAVSCLSRRERVR